MELNKRRMVSTVGCAEVLWTNFMYFHYRRGMKALFDSLCIKELPFWILAFTCL